MTAAEIADLLLATQDLSAQTAMDFTSILFAYILVAHFAGPTLSRVQILLITTLYSLFLVAVASGFINTINQLIFLKTEFHRLHPHEASGLASGLAAATDTPLDNALGFINALVLFGGWALSLAYMATTRRNVAQPS
jgi:hypothetical protein